MSHLELVVKSTVSFTSMKDTSSLSFKNILLHLKHLCGLLNTNKTLIKLLPRLVLVAVAFLKVTTFWVIFEICYIQLCTRIRPVSVESFIALF